MRIEVSQVQQQLAEESTYLEKALVDTEDLIIELNNFVFENNLTGSAYLSIKIFYSSVVLPLAKAMAHMYQAKLNANHRYSSSLRSFFGSITYIDQAELQERLDATRRRRRSLEDDDDNWIPWRLIRRLRAIERLLQRKIESVDDFNYATANYYVDFQRAVTLVKQGFESANKVQYSGVSGYIYNFSLALSWAKTINQIYPSVKVDSSAQNGSNSAINIADSETRSHVVGGYVNQPKSRGHGISSHSTEFNQALQAATSQNPNAYAFKVRYRSGQLVLVPLTKEQVVAQKNVVTYSVLAGTLIYVAGPSVLQAGSYIAVTTLDKAQQLGQSISVGGGPVPALAGVGAFDTAVAAESAVSIPLIGQGAVTLADAETFALLMDGMGSGGKGGLGNSSGNPKWNDDSFDDIASSLSPEGLVKRLEENGWIKRIEEGGGKSGPATILTNLENGMEIRIHCTPKLGSAYFRVKNAAGNYLDANGVFPSEASRQELRDLTHFYFSE